MGAGYKQIFHTFFKDFSRTASGGVPTESGGLAPFFCAWSAYNQGSVSAKSGDRTRRGARTRRFDRACPGHRRGWKAPRMGKTEQWGRFEISFGSRRRRQFLACIRIHCATGAGRARSPSIGIRSTATASTGRAIWTRFACGDRKGACSGTFRALGASEHVCELSPSARSVERGGLPSRSSAE